jgi:galactokinase/mevalonate kinase-like predicted kinase
LDALATGISRKKVNWVLDADIRDFFTSLDHDWLQKFLEHRIADKRVLRLIDKWVSAGVIEDGAWKASEIGAPQGGLCAAAHKPPYEQCRVMRSVGPSSLVKAGSGTERCT